MRQEVELEFQGSCVAAVLAGAWRPDPPPLSLDPEGLAAAIPHLLRCPAVALAWWRLRSQGLPARCTRQLRHVYNLCVLQAARHEQHLQEVIPSLRAAGVEPILIKGWSVARLYPETCLRPYGDLDLCVRPDHVPRAMAALDRLDVLPYIVELHKSVPDLKDHRWEEIFQRTRPARLGDVNVRVLGPEDQFRLLCLHQMRHGASSPSWLCDLAVALESRPDDFDWDLCLRGHRGWSGWVLCFAHLAGTLLGARLDGPAPVPPIDVPAWLGPTVLARWARPLEEPGTLDPIKSAYRLKAYPGLSRPATQLLGLLRRIPEAPSRLFRQSRRWRRVYNLPFGVHEDPGK